MNYWRVRMATYATSTCTFLSHCWFNIATACTMLPPAISTTLIHRVIWLLKFMDWLISDLWWRYNWQLSPTNSTPNKTIIWTHSTFLTDNKISTHTWKRQYFKSHKFYDTTRHTKTHKWYIAIHTFKTSSWQSIRMGPCTQLVKKIGLELMGKIWVFESKISTSTWILPFEAFCWNWIQQATFGGKRFFLRTVNIVEVQF